MRDAPFRRSARPVSGWRSGRGSVPRRRLPGEEPASIPEIGAIGSGRVQALKALVQTADRPAGQDVVTHLPKAPHRKSVLGLWVVPFVDHFEDTERGLDRRPLASRGSHRQSSRRCPRAAWQPEPTRRRSDPASRPPPPATAGEDQKPSQLRDVLTDLGPGPVLGVRRTQARESISQLPGRVCLRLAQSGDPILPVAARHPHSIAPPPPDAHTRLYSPKWKARMVHHAYTNTSVLKRLNGHSICSWRRAHLA